MSMPKNGNVAEPGFCGVQPGSGVTRMPPVSVCQYVSTMLHVVYECGGSVASTVGRSRV